MGDEGAGHFVKMVHNGIEYGDMQLICEAYHLMKDVVGMDHDAMAQVSTTYHAPFLLIVLTCAISLYCQEEFTLDVPVPDCLSL